MKELHEESSLFKRWHFTPVTLLERRQRTHFEAVDVIKKGIEEENKLGPPSRIPPPSFPTLEEHEYWVNFFLNALKQNLLGWNFGNTVFVTAVSYLKRFYVTRSALIYDPRHVLAVCVFLALKATDRWDRNSSLPKFLQDYFKNKCPPAPVILTLEMVLSSGINYDYHVPNPFWSLRGFYCELTEGISNLPTTPLETSGGTTDKDMTFSTSIKTLAGLYVRAENFLQTAVLTDAYLLYSPPQLALACISRSLSTLRSEGKLSDLDSVSIEVERYIEELTSGSPLLSRQLSQISDMIGAWLNGATTKSKDEMRDLSAKFRSCVNPALDRSSLFYSKLKREREDAKNYKDREKRLKEGSKGEDGDVFGI